MTSKENQPATPLPWHVGLRQAEQIVYDVKGWAVANATVYHGESDLAETKANARYIAHACDAYPQMVATLRDVLAHLWDDRKRDVKKNFSLMNAEACAMKLLRDLGEIK